MSACGPPCVWARGGIIILTVCVPMAHCRVPGVVYNAIGSCLVLVCNNSLFACVCVYVCAALLTTINY